jgi:hypothetical protein
MQKTLNWFTRVYKSKFFFIRKFRKNISLILFLYQSNSFLYLHRNLIFKKQKFDFSFINFFFFNKKKNFKELFILKKSNTRFTSFFKTRSRESFLFFKKNRLKKKNNVKKK